MDLLLPALAVGDVQASHVVHQNSASLGLLADEAVNGLLEVGVVADMPSTLLITLLKDSSILLVPSGETISSSSHQLELVPQVVFEERLLLGTVV